MIDKKLKEQCLVCRNWTGGSCKVGLNAHMAIHWDNVIKCGYYADKGGRGK